MARLAEERAAILDRYSDLNQYFYFDVQKKKKVLSQILTVAISNSYIAVKNDNVIMNKRL